MIDDLTRRLAKGACNRRAYAMSKSKQDHLLLRLPKGGSAGLDNACAATGLSRSAFAVLYLSPLLEALAPALPAIDAACRRDGHGLSRFMSAAIASALDQAEKDGTARDTATATCFDQMFGLED